MCKVFAQKDFVSCWLTQWTVNLLAKGSTPGRDRVNELLVRPSQHLCRIVMDSLAFVCIARVKIVAHVKAPMSTIRPAGRCPWQIMSVAAPNRRTRKKPETWIGQEK